MDNTRKRTLPRRFYTVTENDVGRRPFVEYLRMWGRGNACFCLKEKVFLSFCGRKWIQNFGEGSDPKTLRACPWRPNQHFGPHWFSFAVATCGHGRRLLPLENMITLTRLKVLFACCEFYEIEKSAMEWLQSSTESVIGFAWMQFCFHVQTESESLFNHGDKLVFWMKVKTKPRVCTIITVKPCQK